MAKPVRLLIAEDHELVGEGLRVMLRGKGLDVAGIVRDGNEVPGAVAALAPDLLLLDLSLPHRGGIDLIAELRASAPTMRILVVTMHLDRVLADTALKLGAHGFVPKDCGIDELLLAVSEVVAGRIHVSPRVPPRPHRAPAADSLPGLATLTPRQHAIVGMIGRGMSSDAIAGTLGVSVHTVHFHRRNIHAALGIDTEPKLIRYAVLASLAEDPPR